MTEEDNPAGPQRRRKTQWIAALKKTLAEAKIKEQQRQWDEATKWRHAMDAALGDVDLETEMEKAEEVEITTATTEGVKTVVTTTTAGSMRTVVTMAAASSSTQVVTAEVYARPYMKTTESRGECSTTRSERKEAMEREAMRQKQKDEEDHIAKEKEVEEQCKVVERALLEEEEKAQAEVLCKLREKTEKKKLKDMAEGEPKKQGKEDKNVSKDEPKKQDKEAKKGSEWEAKKRKYGEEEKWYADDEELDPDFDPDKEFIEEDDMIIEDDDEEDTFQVHKHSHALNFVEAGEFVVWVRVTLNKLQRVVKRGKEMEKYYRQFVSVLKDAIIQMGSWGPIEGADMEAVVKTIVDINCTAWRKAMQGVKMGNSKTIMKIEEKREGVIRVIEDKDILGEDDTTVVDPEQLKGKTEEEKKEVKRMLRKFFSHVEKGT